MCGHVDEQRVVSILKAAAEKQRQARRLGSIVTTGLRSQHTRCVRVRRLDRVDDGEQGGWYPVKERYGLSILTSDVGVKPFLFLGAQQTQVFLFPGSTKDTSPQPACPYPTR